MSGSSAPESGSFPGLIGKPSRDTGRVFGADLGYDDALTRSGHVGSAGSGAVLAGLAIAEVLTAAVLSIVVGWSWRDALEAFVVTNSVMGVSVCRRVAGSDMAPPHNPIGLAVCGRWPGSARRRRFARAFDPAADRRAGVSADLPSAWR